MHLFHKWEYLESCTLTKYYGNDRTGERWEVDVAGQKMKCSVCNKVKYREINT